MKQTKKKETTLKTRKFTITGLPETQYEWLERKAEEMGVTISSYAKMVFSEKMKKEAKK